MLKINIIYLVYVKKKVKILLRSWIKIKNVEIKN